MKLRAEEASEPGRKGRRRNGVSSAVVMSESIAGKTGEVRAATAYIPLDFNSWVQIWMSSWTSSGATSLRDHDSSHRGLGGGSGWLSASSNFPFLPPSRGLKTFAKNGIVICCDKATGRVASTALWPVDLPRAQGVRAIEAGGRRRRRRRVIGVVETGFGWSERRAHA